MSEMSKSCLLNCVISALKETNLNDFEIGTDLDAIRFSVDGHKVRVTVRGRVSDGLPLNAEVEWILGRPNFWCGPLAEVLRSKGFEIERKSEAEQAFCIHWMLGLYLKDRAGWREAFDREMQS